MELPQKYLDSMKELLGDEFQTYLDSFSQKRLYGLRVNNLKISTEDFLKISPFKLKKIPWIDNGFYYEEEDKPAKHPYYFAGLYYLQEPSAMTPASILPIEHGDKVLDVCAAPGGKSTELGARLGGTGLLVSNDISASRAKALLKNIEVSGIGNVVITCEEPGKLISSFESFFDKILIDAPCSGEGMFRKDNKLIKSWQMNGPEYFAAIQKSILSQAAQMLKPGGYMLYSTCTFSKLEDEDNIHLFLESHPDFSLVDIFDSGIPSIHPYEGFSKGIGLPQCVRIFPHKMQGEGHFVALLKKDGEAIQDSPVHGRPNKLPDELTAFLDELNFEIPSSDIIIQKDNVYYLPPLAGKLKGLRAMRTGTLLGELKKNRFEPSQAFAMTLKDGQYSSQINLKLSDDAVIRYLKGETIEVDESCVTGNSSIKLIMVDGYPLGWGKYNNGQVKNKYLPGWRWM